MDNLEAACRLLCWKYGVPEDYWPIYQNTWSAVGIALHLAWRGLCHAVKNEFLNLVDFKKG